MCVSICISAIAYVLSKIRLHGSYSQYAMHLCLYPCISFSLHIECELNISIMWMALIMKSSPGISWTQAPWLHINCMEVAQGSPCSSFTQQFQCLVVKLVSKPPIAGVFPLEIFEKYLIDNIGDLPILIKIRTLRTLHEFLMYVQFLLRPVHVPGDRGRNSAGAEGAMIMRCKHHEESHPSNTKESSPPKMEA